jgi:WD40 repeat protein
MLASGSDDRTIKLWDVHSGQCTGTLQGHKQDIFALSFSPDGRTLASAARGNDVKLWDVNAHRCLTTLVGHQDMVFTICHHPDGRTLVSAGKDETVMLWDLAYYDRHIAGNLEHQISNLPSAGRDNATVEHLRAWATEVLPRPWPRPLWANPSGNSPATVPAARNAQE